ncbi:CRISPR-associated endonuclease Cas1, partial [bacterium]|nr:CRISPR-associated endonuclease Cas1 [bacterium]
MNNQNTLYLTTPGTVLVRDHLTLRVEIEKKTKLAVPIHHLESICAFGQVIITPHAMSLCWDHQVSIHYHTENGYLLARVTGSGDTSYLLRRAQYTAADAPARAWAIARQIIAGKLQNSRANLLRSKREVAAGADQNKLTFTAREIARLIRQLGQATPPDEDTTLREALDPIRGIEGIAAKLY